MSGGISEEARAILQAMRTMSRVEDLDMDGHLLDPARDILKVIKRMSRVDDLSEDQCTEIESNVRELHRLFKKANRLLCPGVLLAPTDRDGFRVICTPALNVPFEGDMHKMTEIRWEDMRAMPELRDVLSADMSSMFAIMHTCSHYCRMATTMGMSEICDFEHAKKLEEFSERPEVTADSEPH